VTTPFHSRSGSSAVSSMNRQSVGVRAGAMTAVRPSPSKDRARQEEKTTLVPSGEVHGPDLPAADEWHAQTRAW
jgi:hypothetical protein